MTVFNECQNMLLYLRRELEEQNLANLRSYLRGYFAGQSDSPFIQYLKSYLRQEHKINSQFNSWEEQITHYAFVNELGWYDAFFKVIAEIWVKKTEIIGVDKRVDNTRKYLWVEEKKIKEAVLKNGLKIKIGDRLCLADKIGTDYKKTKFYDGTLDAPSWELFYPSERDFEHLHVFCGMPGVPYLNTYAPVRGLFGGSVVVIDDLAVVAQSHMAYTTAFRIDLEKALESGEISVITNQSRSPVKAFESLKEHLQNFESGLIAENPEDILDRWSHTMVAHLGKDWVKFDKSLGSRVWEKRRIEAKTST